MQTDVVRHVTLIIVPREIQIPDYFYAYFPALRKTQYASVSHCEERAMEIYINDAYYGSVSKNELGFYPELYIPLNDQATSFYIKGASSNTCYSSITVPQGTEEYHVVFCEKYPNLPAVGRNYPRREDIELTEYDTTDLLIDVIVSGLQPDGAIYHAMTEPQVLHTRMAFVDGGVEFHHITDPHTPAYIPAANIQFISFDALRSQAERSYIALNDQDCLRLQRLLETVLPPREDLQHLHFFTEDDCLCVMPIQE